MTDPVIEAEAWVVRFLLERPIHLGRWMIRHREYAVLELTTAAGLRAAAYALTRDAKLTPALSEAVRRALGRKPSELKMATSGANGADRNAARAAALLDACAWDLSAQQRGLPLWALLAADDPPADPPAARGVAVCGYPVGGPPDAATVATEAEAALADGYTSFKIPGVGSAEEVDDRLEAICGLDDRVEMIVDLEGAQTQVEPVLAMARRWKRHPLLWLEDPFLASQVAMTAELAASSPIPIAIGDEWTESELRSLLPLSPRPLLRLDFATLGGISSARALALEAGADAAQHIYPELQRHLVHAGLAVPWLDVYREDPVIDFADRMLGHTAFRAAVAEAPADPGPCMQLDREAISAHATWHIFREIEAAAPKVG